ncbi:ABC transporter ATP-binding protein [Variovorax ginsengisoli]|uniref:ABC transporter ATP-binding protein n=1 Tax=Variovorax ginsengisoli TaxID=363844 RepID=A0ABT8SAE1_9BURK|nr:ABC transporter ATP-binding protein [Variovorax ginsengisoli]MDN8616703.1 ABC transporter ATP-binding protein [Variovorax ginsengisoli]MDO1535873.1 ABC transporter ATP-binding protein [Variovorax ginsengisoli]
MKFRTGSLLGIALISLASHTAFGQPSDVQDSFSKEPWWELVVGPFAVHFSNEDEHTHVYLLGLERNQPDGWMWGLSAFQNSFGQASAYAYYGYRWDNLFGYPSLYFKLSGGIIYGYVGQYKDKVPYNHDGFGLGIIPAIGYKFTKADSVQIGTLGTAGLIFTYNRKF